jgi:hypothetical protein
MIRTVFSTLLIFVFCFSAYSASPPLKAVWLMGAYDPNPAFCNSDAAFKLYKALGYNTVFEGIVFPEGSTWTTTSTTQWTCDSDHRTNLVNYIQGQKTRLNALGLEYSPFYADLGWGGGAYNISERDLASVYREVAYIQNYYGNDICVSLISNSSTIFSPETSNAAWHKTNGIIDGLNMSNSTAAASITFPVGSSTLKKDQCYDFSMTITIPAGSNLQVGAQIQISLMRQFESDNKPDTSNIPLGYLVNSYGYQEINTRKYTIISASNNKDSIKEEVTNRIVCGHSNTFTIHQLAWIEDTFHFGADNYRFQSNFIWYFALMSRSGSSVALSNFHISPVDPKSQLAYSTWETNSAALFQADSTLYPYEQYVTTRATYLTTNENDFSFTHTEDYFSYTPPIFTPPAHEKLTKLTGNFLPVVEGAYAPLNRHTADPLSPVHDLVSNEMLAIIKEGLGGQEPKYYSLAGDELLIFRRDNASRKDGPNPVFKNCSNGEFFARLLEREVQRYKNIFKPSASVTTKFVFWADMITFSGEGYKYYADSNTDENALQYLQANVSPNFQLIPAIWIYVDSPLPGSTSNPPAPYLSDPSSIKIRTIDILKKHNFQFIATYSTAKSFLPSDTIPNEQRIQTEINMARSWCDIAQSESSMLPTNVNSFEGYIYAPWDGCFRTYKWNGLYSLAYFGWTKQNARDFPSGWKKIYPTLDGDSQPILDLLVKGINPFFNIIPILQLLLDD